VDDVNSDEVPTTGVRDSQQNIVLLSVNPRAGARSGTDRVDALEAELKSLGFITDRQTDIETVAQRARQYQEEGRLRSVVAAGGDGTVSLVLNNTPIGVPLAVLPLGTENLLARYFRLQMPVPKIAGLIQQGFTKTLDVGIANGRLFLLMVGVGFDAAVVEEVDRRRTGHIHKWSYFKPIWNALRTYRYPTMQVSDPSAAGAEETAGTVETPPVCWAFVVNLPRYAGGLSIVPHADGTDGELDLCTFRRGRFWRTLKYLIALTFRRHGSLQDCEMTKVTRVRISPVNDLESPGEIETPYQLDGDPGGVLPVDIEVIPNRLRLIVPPPRSRARITDLGKVF
jgi:diacylglycerol kinase (ATP)